MYVKPNPRAIGEMQRANPYADLDKILSPDPIRKRDPLKMSERIKKRLSGIHGFQDPSLEDYIMGAIGEYPNDLVFPTQLAQYYIRIGSPERALEVAPDDRVGKGIQAKTYIALHRYWEALVVAPNDPVGLRFQAEALRNLGFYNIGKVVGSQIDGEVNIVSALNDLPSFNNNPLTAVGHYVRGLLFYKQGELKPASDEAIRSINADHNDKKIEIYALALIYATHQEMGTLTSEIIEVIESSVDHEAYLSIIEGAKILAKSKVFAIKIHPGLFRELDRMNL